MDKARRYNNGKLRYELIPTEFEKALAHVYTIGAEKYSIKDKDGNIIEDGANNWRKGLSWKQTLGAVYRHLEKFDSGEDFDNDYPKELLEKYGPTYHLANAAWGIATLLSYYHIHPQGDDRATFIKPLRRVGIDIDDVLADFLEAYCARYNLKKPSAWMFDQQWDERYKEIIEDPDFYRELNTILSPTDLPFEPVVYITSRSEKLKEKTLQWLFDYNKYPVAPVVFTKDKLPACKEHKVDVFIDDKFDTFHNLNCNGVFCYLFDSSHNQRYNVGHRRINKETIKNIL